MNSPYDASNEQRDTKQNTANTEQKIVPTTRVAQGVGWSKAGNRYGFGGGDALH